MRWLLAIAKKFNGEIISADSRQVYRGLNIGTGKVTKKEMGGVRHHLLDVARPQTRFNADTYKTLAEKVLKEIRQRNKVPIICGGTGFYIKSLVDQITFPNVEPNLELRKKLEKKSAVELFGMLKKLDAKRSKTIDKNNPIRLIRAIEIAKALGKNPKIAKQPNSFRFLQIRFKS